MAQTVVQDMMQTQDQPRMQLACGSDISPDFLDPGNAAYAQPARITEGVDAAGVLYRS